MEVASEGLIDFKKVRSPREKFLDEIIGGLTNRANLVLNGKGMEEVEIAEDDLDYGLVAHRDQEL